MVHRATKNSVLVVLALVGSACGIRASSTKNTASNPVVSYGLPQKSTGEFPSPLSAALESLSSHMPIPLLAPSAIPADLSAKTSSTQSGYKISLYHCQSKLTLNNSEIGNAPNCSGSASYFGDFDGTHYATASTANLWLSTLQNQRTRFCGPNSNSSQQVGLARGVQGVLTSTKGASGYCEMHFDLNGWSVLIGGNAALYSIAEAKQEGSRVIDLMTKVRMPAKNGIVVIQTAGDGNHTWMTWTTGENLYTVSGYHSTSSAFSMTGSLASVRGVPQK